MSSPHGRGSAASEVGSPFSVDSAYEFDAPGYFDFSALAENRSGLEPDDSWFDVQEPEPERPAARAARPLLSEEEIAELRAEREAQLQAAERAADDEAVARTLAVEATFEADRLAYQAELYADKAAEVDTELASGYGLNTYTSQHSRQQAAWGRTAQEAYSGGEPANEYHATPTEEHADDSGNETYQASIEGFAAAERAAQAFLDGRRSSVKRSSIATEHDEYPTSGRSAGLREDLGRSSTGYDNGNGYSESETEKNYSNLRAEATFYSEQEQEQGYGYPDQTSSSMQPAKRRMFGGPSAQRNVASMVHGAGVQRVKPQQHSTKAHPSSSYEHNEPSNSQVVRRPSSQHNRKQQHASAQHVMNQQKKQPHLWSTSGERARGPTNSSLVGDQKQHGGRLADDYALMRQREQKNEEEARRRRQVLQQQCAEVAKTSRQAKGPEHLANHSFKRPKPESTEERIIRERAEALQRRRDKIAGKIDPLQELRERQGANQQQQRPRARPQPMKERTLTRARSPKFATLSRSHSRGYREPTEPVMQKPTRATEYVPSQAYRTSRQPIAQKLTKPQPFELRSSSRAHPSRGQTVESLPERSRVQSFKRSTRAGAVPAVRQARGMERSTTASGQFYGLGDSSGSGFGAGSRSQSNTPQRRLSKLTIPRSPKFSSARRAELRASLQAQHASKDFSEFGASNPAANSRRSSLQKSNVVFGSTFTPSKQADGGIRRSSTAVNQPTRVHEFTLSTEKRARSRSAYDIANTHSDTESSFDSSYLDNSSRRSSATRAQVLSRAGSSSSYGASYEPRVTTNRKRPVQAEAGEAIVPHQLQRTLTARHQAAPRPTTTRNTNSNFVPASYQQQRYALEDPDELTASRFAALPPMKKARKASWAPAYDLSVDTASLSAQPSSDMLGSLFSPGARPSAVHSPKFFGGRARQALLEIQQNV